MKNSKVFIFILLLLLVLTGCATTSEMSNLAPLSLYSRRAFSGKNQVYFVGEGHADSQRQAELLAYLDLNTKVYRYLGIVEEPESYRELTSSGTISKYKLKIQEKTAYESKGEFIFVISASADETLLATDRSPDMQKEDEVAEQAAALILKGDEFMMENHTVEGLHCYLQSLVYSYGLQYIEEEFSFSVMLEEILRNIEALHIEISKPNPDEITCDLQVKKNDTIIPSVVVYSEVLASFISTDSRGNSFTDSFTYTTDGEGKIKFVPRMYNLANSGTITFSFDFESEIKEVEKLSPFSASLIRAAIKEKEVKFDYNKKIDVVPFAICVQCEDLQGETDKSSWLAQYLAEKYSESGINTVTMEYIEGESKQDMLARFKSMYPKYKDVLVLRVGPNSFFETKMGIFSMGVEGVVIVYDSATGAELYNSDVVFANGIGNSAEEAQETAIKNFVLNLFTLLKAYYV